MRFFIYFICSLPFTIHIALKFHFYILHFLKNVTSKKNTCHSNNHCTAMMFFLSFLQSILLYINHHMYMKSSPLLPPLSTLYPIQHSLNFFDVFPFNFLVNWFIFLLCVCLHYFMFDNNIFFSILFWRKKIQKNTNRLKCLIRKTLTVSLEKKKRTKNEKIICIEFVKDGITMCYCLLENAVAVTLEV